MQNVKDTLPFLLFMSPFFIHGQSIERSVISSSGDHLSNGDYTLDYTTGEMVAQTFEHGAALSQGFHQVWAIATALTDLNQEEWNVNVFPNPTVGLLNVETKEALQGRIINTSGQLILENEIEPGHRTMDLTNLPVGTYFLLLKYNKEEKPKTFRIIKIQ